MSAPKLYDISKLKPTRFAKVVQYILEPSIRQLNSDLQPVKKKPKVQASLYVAVEEAPIVKPRAKKAAKKKVVKAKEPDMFPKAKGLMDSTEEVKRGPVFAKD